MGEVHEQVVVQCSPARAWELVSDFTGVLKLVGVDVVGEGADVGAIRTVASQGGTIVERLESLDNTGRRLAYSMPERGWLPVIDYEGRMQVSSLPEGQAEISWSASFRSDGADDTLVTSQLTQRFAGYLRRLKTVLEDAV